MARTSITPSATTVLSNVPLTMNLVVAILLSKSRAHSILLEVTCYKEGYDRGGKVTTTSTTSSSLTHGLEGEALYCFKVELE